jgi:hypothetical protein
VGEQKHKQMAAEVYKAPDGVELPEIDWANFNHEEYEAANQKYLDDLKAKLQEMGYKGKNMGEVIKFPFADGYAMYMVASMNPLKLIHIALGDAWDYPNVDLMTPVRVQEMIDQQKALEEIFSKNKKQKGD